MQAIVRCPNETVILHLTISYLAWRTNFLQSSTTLQIVARRPIQYIKVQLELTERSKDSASSRFP